jgi:SAM-dependent methyltransferase
MQFDYALEKDYYAQGWPTGALPYRHLEPYLTSWLSNPRDLFDHKTIVDIGAGEATYTRLIGDIFEPRLLLACDLFTERMVPASKANHNRNLFFATADVFKLPLKQHSVDTVFGSLVLHQLPDLEQVLREVSRVLRIGGYYIGIEPNFINPAIFYRYLKKANSKNTYLLTKPKLVSGFKLSGFDILISYFYARRPLLRGRFFGTCIGIRAQKQT